MRKSPEQAPLTAPDELKVSGPTTIGCGAGAGAALPAATATTAIRGTFACAGNRIGCALFGVNGLLCDEATDEAHCDKCGDV